MQLQAYSRVVELAPHHYQARLQLSLVMQQLDWTEGALDTLQHDEQAELLNPHLMYSRCCSLLPALCYGLPATCYLLHALCSMLSAPCFLLSAL